MIKYIVCVLIFSFNLSVMAQKMDIKDLRRKYKAAVNDEKEADAFYQTLSIKGSGLQPIENAYRGASEALMARNAKALNKKMSYLKSFERTFDMAIQQDSENIEIRFLRFAILKNLPVFLGDSKKKAEDKHVIVTNLSRAEDFSVGKEFKQEIIHYMLESGELTATEEKKLKSMVN